MGKTAAACCSEPTDLFHLLPSCIPALRLSHVSRLGQMNDITTYLPTACTDRDTFWRQAALDMAMPARQTSWSRTSPTQLREIKADREADGDGGLHHRELC